MFIVPEKTGPRKKTVDIGPPPYYHRSDCFICRMQDGLVALPAGSYIFEGKHFVVQHAPLKQANAGTVIVASRRHLLDFGETTKAEGAELGTILKRVVPAIKATTGAHRAYFLALMERVPHFHLWLVPKKKHTALKGVAFLARHADPASSSAAEAFVKKVRRRLERS